jgi:hypothetical protein
MNNTDIQNINRIITVHYNAQTKQIFDFLSDFMTNKFYNIVFELAKKYSVKNGLSISDNYKNIFDSYMDTLSINSQEEEECKNQMFSVFLNHLYESYIKYVNNQIISINDFIISVNIAFLPDNYKNDTYIQNKQNLSILFHTLIYNLSKELYIYINNNMNHIILDRINENAILLQKECIKSLSVIRNELFIKFEQQDNDINTGLIENDIILNSNVYKELLSNHESNYNQIEKMKKGIIQMLQREKNYKRDIEKLLNLINILTQKQKKQQDQQSQSNQHDDQRSQLSQSNQHDDQRSQLSQSNQHDDQRSHESHEHSDEHSDEHSNKHSDKHSDEHSGEHSGDNNKHNEQINLNNLFNDNDFDLKSETSNSSDIGSSSKIKSELESLFSG